MDKNRKKCLTVLSLGAGVQSSTMAIMSAKGNFPPVDCAIFADTGYEPKAVYKYLNFLEKILPYPIYLVQKGNIKDDLLKAKGTTEFSVAPFFTQETVTGKKGMIRRQCTNDYKIQPLKKKIRELCNVGYKKHFPKDKYVEQWIGISKDEIQRMKPARDSYILHRHPLIEANMSRQDCVNYLKKENIPLPEKSACIMCPFHDDKYWQFMKTKRPEEFADAVELDKEIRTLSKNPNIKNYVHKSCKPLDEVNFNPNENQLDMFNNECEGLCGV
jgi:3'-phosphoadenosine 5'-phosphosulfate sulfotransferase (PAPS reductase)/FAD synthetase